MGLDSRRLFAPTVAAFSPTFDRITKAVPTGGNTTPAAVLTYPIKDLDGDVLEPAGISLHEFNTRFERLSNFEHGHYIGTTDVQFKSMPRLDAHGKPDEALGMIALPVGVTTFFESSADAARHTLRKFDQDGRVDPADPVWDADACARVADHVRPLVPGVFGGVSLEFRPDGPEGVSRKSIGYCKRLGRDSWHFIKTTMIGLASACEIPVNKFAGYVQPTAETLARAEKALRYCERPDSLDFIRKSLSPLVRVLTAKPNGRVVVPVKRGTTMGSAATLERVKKAGMYGEPDGDEMAPPPPVDDPTTVGDESMGEADSGVTATAAAAFQASQGLLDLCDMLRQQVAKGEHVKGKKKLLALCDGLEKDAANAKAIGDMVTAEVGGKDDEEAEVPDEPDAPETDEEGGIVDKSFGSYRPQRVALIPSTGSPWKASDLKPVVGRKAKPVPAGQVMVSEKYLRDLEAAAGIEAD